MGRFTCKFPVSREKVFLSGKYPCKLVFIRREWEARPLKGSQ
jgi:hypothetical protein